MFAPWIVHRVGGQNDQNRGGGLAGGLDDDGGSEGRECPPAIPGRRLLNRRFALSASPEERVARDGDLVGNKLRIIEGGKLTNGYEMSCTITTVNAKGASIRFDAMCNAEGEMEPVKGSWRKVSDTSFRIGERVFEKCE